MRIKEIEVKNWRTYGEARVELEPVSVFVGRNNSGKSSLAGAVEFALTGKTQWTEGQGLESLIRNNAGAAQVALEIEGVGRVTRSIPHELKVQGVRAKAIGKHQEALFDKLGGVNEAEVRAAMSGRRLTEGTERVGSMLAARLGLQFGKGEIKKQARAWIERHKKDHEAATFALRLIDRKDENPLDIEGGVEALEKAEKDLRAERTAVNRIVRKGEPEEPTRDESLGDIGTKRLALQEAERRRAKLDRSAIENAKARLSEIVGRGVSLKNTIDRLSGADGACPLAPDRIKCPLEASYLDQLVEALKAERAQLAEEYESVKAEVDRLEAAFKSESEAIEKEIAALRDEISAIEAEDRAWDQWQDAYKAWESAKQDSAALDLVIEAVSDRGFLADLLEERLPELTAQVNEWLATLTDGAYRVAFRWEKGMQIDVEASGRTTPLGLLSESEQKRVGIVLQAILAKLSGVRFVMVDEADELDPHNRAALTNLLLDLREKGVIEQAIVLSTLGDIVPHDPGIPGVGVYMIEEGSIRRLARDNAA